MNYVCALSSILKVAGIAGFAWISFIGSAESLHTLPLSTPGIEESFEPRRLFLLVGVESFADSAFADLEFPGKDIQDLERFFLKHNRKRFDIVKSLSNEQATTANVQKALDQLESANQSENDTVVIYLSTHGTLGHDYTKSLRRYAAMHDTRMSALVQTGLPIGYLQERLARFRSKRKALVLALCHSGSGKSTLPSEIRKELSTLKNGISAIPFLEASSAMMVLSASGWGQPAREDRRLQNDIYTHYLIEGLSDHDSNQDGAVSLFEAHEYARTKTYDFTLGKQTPSALVNMEGMDPIILNGNVQNRAKPLIFADSEGFRHLQLSINGQAKGSLWQSKEAQNGRVRIRLTDPKYQEAPLLDRYVYLRSNQSYSVSGLLRRRPSYQLEVQVRESPLRADAVGAGSRFVPGVQFGATEILGSRWSGGVSYSRVRSERGVTVDYEVSQAFVQADILRLTAGFGWMPLTWMKIDGFGGLEWLAVDRSIENAALTNPHQSATVAYPILGMAGTWQNFWGSSYLRLASALGFVATDPLKMDGTHLLRTGANSSLGLGFKF